MERGGLGETETGRRDETVRQRWVTEERGELGETETGRRDETMR